MKRIAIVIFVGEKGGVEEALINMLNTIDYSKYKVDLYTNIQNNNWVDQYIDRLPTSINIIDVLDFTTKKLARKFFCEKHGTLFLKLCLTYLSARNIKSTTKRMERLSKGFLISNINYDCVIAYKMNYDTVVTSLFQIKGKKKIFWIHGYLWNYPKYDPIYLNWITRFDHIFAVSETVMKETCIVIPNIKDKISVFQNIIDTERILKKSEEVSIISEMPNNDGKALLTVARFAPEKNIAAIPNICKKIVDAGCNVYWYIIGDGDEHNLIEKNIKETRISKNVILLGYKDNPYPYIKKCDFYIQPSLHEGAGIAVKEAQILQKPVIITNYTSAQSQINHGIDGFIVPINTNECASAIVSILNQTDSILSVVNNIKNMDFSNKNEIHKLYKLI